VRDSERDRVLEVPLWQVPEFVEAQELGIETFRTGIIPRETFQVASSRSAELHALSNLLHNGGSADGARFSPPVLCRLADTPEFEEVGRRLIRCEVVPGRTR
jgi:hypothetical protein